MAFNPFNWFRRHQKVLFVGLILITVVIFIGSFGRGDVFDFLSNRITSKRGLGPVIMTVGGKKVHEGEVDNLARKRKLASDYLASMVWEAHPRVAKDLLDNKLAKGSGPDNPLSGLREIVEATQRRPQMIMQFAQQGFPPFFLLQQIQEDLNRIEEIASREKVKEDPEKIAILQQVSTILGFQAWLALDPRSMVALIRGRAPNDYYFGQMHGGGEVTYIQRLEENLDFLLWQHQADRLGIKLSDADVRREVLSEAAGWAGVFGEENTNFHNDKRVKDFLRNNASEFRNISTQDLLDALRDEFRVVMAQGVLLGQEPGVRLYRSLLGAAASPAVASPDEFYRFVREHRTTLSVKFYPLPVSAFVDQIKPPKSDKELLALFQAYEKIEPSAASPNPGFKEPRRVAVEHLSGSADDSFYRQRADVLVRMARPAMILGAIGAPPFNVLAGLAYDPIDEVYRRDFLEGKDELAWFYNRFDTLSMLEEKLKQLHNSSVFAPATLGSTLASTLTAGGGNPLQATGTLFLNASYQEINTNLLFSLKVLTAQANPQTLFANAASIVNALPQPVPLSSVETVILDRIRSQVAANELRRNFETIRTELAKLKSKPEAARKYIDTAAKDYHLTLARMTEARTRDQLIDGVRKGTEKALMPLFEALHTRERKERPEDFASRLTFGAGVFEVQPLRAAPPSTREFLFWRHQDIPAARREFAKIRDEVLQAWKFREARSVVARKAEALETEINEKKLNASDVTRFLAEQKLPGQPFVLEGIAQSVPPKETLAMRRTEYQPFAIPEDKQDLFPHPPADLAKRLITLQRPGEATVIFDQPANVFYLAVLQERNEPTLEDFKRIYTRTPKEDSLYTRFLMTQRDDFRKSILEQLRREAGVADEQGKYKLPDEVRRRESAPSEGE